VPRDIVPSLRFPVGERTKAEVRAIARQLGLATAEKPESQEICFVPDGDYAGFLANRLGEHASLQPGRLVTANVETVGTHGGYARYTVGQRRGLGGGRARALYVLAVRPDTNEVVVGAEPALYADQVTITDLNWIAPPPEPGERVFVQLRHRARAAAARVTHIDADSTALCLEHAQRAVTPGQSGVVYRGEELVGGGRIIRDAA
jgi:tRNA-specific 2-thiouridylase